MAHSLRGVSSWWVGPIVLPLWRDSTSQLGCVEGPNHPLHGWEVKDKGEWVGVPESPSGAHPQWPKDLSLDLPGKDPTTYQWHMLRTQVQPMGLWEALEMQATPMASAPMKQYPAFCASSLLHFFLSFHHSSTRLHFQTCQVLPAVWSAGSKFFVSLKEAQWKLDLDSSLGTFPHHTNYVSSLWRGDH